jgi:hypothetical protein
MSSPGSVDDLLAAQKRLNDVKQMTNDPKEIAKAQQALLDARARFSALAKAARKQ